MSALAIVAAALLATAVAEEPLGEAPPGPATVRLVYGGGAGGLGAEAYDVELHHRLGPALAALDARAVDATPSHAVLSQGPWTLWLDDDRVGSAAPFLAAGPTCAPPERRAAVRTPTEWLVLPDGPLAALADTLPDVSPAPVDVAVCEAAGRTAHLIAPAGTPGAPTWELTAFDVRRGTRVAVSAAGRVDTLWLAALPRHEATRRVARVRALLAERPDALFVDAGDFVDAWSAHADGAPSLHRDNAFALLAQLGPDALVPGAGELVEGPAALLDRARRLGLPYVAANWRADDPALALPPAARVAVATPGGEVDLALIGVIDPTLLRAMDLARLGGVTLDDPIAAAQAAADALRAEADPPDVVALVVQGTPTLLAELRRRLRGVDLLLGDRTAATLRVGVETLDLVPTARGDRAAPVTLPLDGVAAASIEVGPDGPARVVVTPASTTADDPADPWVTAAVTRVRASVLPGLDGPWIPPPPGDPLGGVSDATWLRLVCEAVLEHTGADAAFLDLAPTWRSTPGPLTGVQVAGRLALADALEVLPIDGDRLQAVLYQAHGVAPVQCGAPTGPGLARVRGRAIESDRTYRVVTTDRTRAHTAIGPLLEGGNTGLLGHLPKVRPVRDDRDEPVTLRRAVLTTLDRWRQEATAPTWPDEVAARSARDKDGQWLLRVRRLAGTVSYFSAMADQAPFATVPETLASTPTTLTYGVDVDVAVEGSGRRVAWDARLRLTTTRLAVTGQGAQETADDLRASTSLVLPVAAFPRRTGFQLQPYAELYLDSELTPLPADDGGLLPRQADLTSHAGLAAAAWRWVRALRVGAFVNQDLAYDKTEWGGRLDLETRHDLLTASALRVTTAWELQVFGDTPRDADEDLRLRLWGDLRLSVRVLRWLGVSLYGQGLLISGRGPTNTGAWGFAPTVGAALDLATAARLDRRGR